MTWPISKTASNDITGDRLVSKTSPSYRDNYSNVFKHSTFELNKKLKAQFTDSIIVTGKQIGRAHV